MKEQLTIEHLTPYLPYGLEIMHNRDNWHFKEKPKAVIFDGLAEVNGISPSNYGNKKIDWFTIFYRENEKVSGNSESTNFKPILRPLSDLTKEIEHNGEKFVPLLKIVDGFFDGGVDAKIQGNKAVWETFSGECGDIVDSHSYEIIFMTDDDGNNYLYKSECSEDKYFEEKPSNIFACLDYVDYKKLHEWHFDTEGLIEKGLAIDKNTLK